MPELDAVSAVVGSNSDSQIDIVVLLVDDQMMVGEAVRRALAGEKQISFHHCADPSQAIAVATALKPTVILQDLVMPGVNGLDLVREYRANPATACVPIVVLSTKDEPATKSQAFALGANDYLVKLPDRLELIARTRYHSAAYISHLQRDASYRALHESQRALAEASLELQRLVRIDGMTGVANRRYFDEYIAEECRRAIRACDPLSMLLIDVDDFKQYNDTYGHPAGDQVLREVARIIQGNCRRPGDLAARYGGEEFVVVLCATPEIGMQAVGEQICQDIGRLRLPHSTARAADHVTVSIGGATLVPQNEHSAALLISMADKALYQAKHDGRNRLVTAPFI